MKKHREGCATRNVLHQGGGIATNSNVLGQRTDISREGSQRLVPIERFRERGRHNAQRDSDSETMPVIWVFEVLEERGECREAGRSKWQVQLRAA
jgi:hypothetical protein